MPNAFIILGGANTRKSSTVRALTGVGRRKAIRVATTQGDIDLFAQISSLQESEILPAAFVAEIQQGGYANVLVTLWVSELYRNGHLYPNGSLYIQEFINQGWTISQLVVLGIANLPYQLPQGSPNPNFIAASTTTPVNRIASLVRTWWNWL